MEWQKWAQLIFLLVMAVRLVNSLMFATTKEDPERLHGFAVNVIIFALAWASGSFSLVFR